jgi:threonine/homoserine/homoserine lactone efflux protein
VWKALSGGLGPVVLVVVERGARRGRRNVGGSERICGFD